MSGRKRGGMFRADLRLGRSLLPHLYLSSLCNPSTLLLPRWTQPRMKPLNAAKPLPLGKLMVRLRHSTLLSSSEQASSRCAGINWLPQGPEEYLKWSEELNELERKKADEEATIAASVLARVRSLFTLSGTSSC